MGNTILIILLAFLVIDIALVAYALNQFRKHGKDRKQKDEKVVPFNSDLNWLLDDEEVKAMHLV